MSAAARLATHPASSEELRHLAASILSERRFGGAPLCGAGDPERARVRARSAMSLTPRAALLLGALALSALLLPLGLVARDARATGASRRARGPIGIGTDFESVREWLPDDDVRHVNWRATQRPGTR